MGQRAARPGQGAARPDQEFTERSGRKNYGAAWGSEKSSSMVQINVADIESGLGFKY